MDGVLIYNSPEIYHEKLPEVLYMYIKWLQDHLHDKKLPQTIYGNLIVI